MQDLQVSRAGRDRMAPSKDASFLGKPSELAKGCPPQPHVTYLQCSLPKKKKRTAFLVETAEWQRKSWRSDCSSQEPLVQNGVTEKMGLRRTYGCSSNSLPGRPELRLFKTQTDSNDCRGPPYHFLPAQPMAFIRM